MALGIFDLFKIGIGPSSSHTVGPMLAAGRFLGELDSLGLTGRVQGVAVHLYGSLALTGRGHATDKAVILGLAGETPESVDPDRADALADDIRKSGRVSLAGAGEVAFEAERDIHFHMDEILDAHPNGLRFQARDGTGAMLADETYYSVGGGFVLSQAEIGGAAQGSNVALPHPFETAADLLKIGAESGLSIAGIALENEMAWRGEQETRDALAAIWAAMEACIERGCQEEGELPGGLGVKRRAKAMRDELADRSEVAPGDSLAALDWVNLFALAVNEENAAGGRVVTAPTNGAAGVIPAVLAYYMRFDPAAGPDSVVTFLATAAAIGMLYKKNASISAAEVGCQGEIGVACSMAAAGLAAVQGGTNAQIENAAEIGMEHNLGLTCDPVGGLVQVPCIERNTMGAVKAINAARLALRGDGSHFVSLDQVIETMRLTGRDMSDKYKETSKGGLAVNAVEC